MTQIEWQQLEATVAAMSDAERHRLAELLESNQKSDKPTESPSIIGLFADEPELMEKVVELIYHDRETAPLRTGR